MSRHQARRTVRFALLYPLLVMTLVAMIGPTTGLLAQQDGAAQDKPEEEKPKTLTEQLGGDDRYLTHLTTDKPIYRAGETMYVRGTILHAFTQKPFDDKQDKIKALQEEIRKIGRPEGEDARKEWDRLQREIHMLHIGSNLNPLVEIKDPKGAVVATSGAQVQDATIGFKWQVPEGQAGGEYTIKVSYPWAGLAPAERTFDIRAYRPPRIRSQIEFLKDGYGPGDTVVATINATRAEGGIPVGAKVTAVARVDGSEVARVQTMIRESGAAVARFELPGQIERGEGSVTFVIEDGGVVESASKTLPILLQTVDLKLYPEGGDLIAGVPNRVYFEARTPFGKPADIKGKLWGVVEGASLEKGFPELGLDLATVHEGRGMFTFTPKPGLDYYIVITEPSSVSEVIELPAAKDGVQLSVSRGVVPAGQPIHIHMHLGEGLFGGSVEVRQREKVLAKQEVVQLSGIRAQNPGETNGDKVDFGILLPDDVSGILAVTAYDGEGNPLAERLVYRQPKNRVNIEILPDSARYTPAGRVQLTIKTTDASGTPVSAVAGLTVTDDSVLEMIETREQAPGLPAMVFLEQEVSELADAHVYLDPDNKDAAEQLDLLLGTQGWRRFALVNLADFIIEHGDDARRMLALRKQVERELKLARERVRALRGDIEADGAVLEEAAVDQLVAQAAPGAAADPQGGGPIPKGEPNDAADKAAAAPPVADLDEALDQAVEAEAKQDAIIAFDEQREEDVARRIRMPRMVFVREYAHKQPPAKPLGQRSDFTETVYWSAATKTNEQGVATVEFDLSDSVTSFRVKADAFTKDGALGAGSELIESVQPFYIEPKLPLELTAGDIVQLPIAMINNTDQQLPVELTFGRLGKAGKDTVTPDALAAETRGRAIYSLTIGKQYGELPFKISATAGLLRDVNHRKVRVVPKGFPIKDGSGGMLQPDGEVTDDIVIPDTVVPGSMSASVTVYPTPLANLTEALKALIREPYGCFEQTSSTTFPLVMAQQYFMTHQGVDPALIADAKEKLDKGYQRLIGFETPEKGYEWFGKAPGHEALTAYGLLQFNEMKQVMDVDQKMIDRTVDWILSRRNGKGSFELDKKQLDSFGGAPQDTTDAYIVWSLLESGYDPAKIQKEIDHVLGKASDGDDAYIIALGANIAAILTELGHEGDFRSVGYPALAKQLCDKLAKKLNDEGSVAGAVTSITRSGGDALKIETTSLAILAWLHDDAYTGQVEKSIKWLTERCKAGRFGSTQSTILALKAIVEYDKARSTPKAPGDLVVIVDGEQVGEPVKFDEETTGAIQLPSVLGKLTPGKHTIAVKMAGGSKMPYSVAVEYHANTPASSDECKLRIITGTGVFPKEIGNPHYKVAEGESTEISVKVINTSKEGLATPIAIVGIPGGLEPSFDQLKELVAAEQIAAFEVIGREVVLYWREMKPEQQIDLSIRCTAAVPGTYTGPASRAYAYYTDEHKQWVDGLTVTITPKQPE